MVFAIVFLLEVVANLLLGIPLARRLDPQSSAATRGVALGAATVATASWLRLSVATQSGQSDS
jgi:hypothetical protein